MRERKIHRYKTLGKLVQRLRDDLRTSNYVLIYGHNGIGKTRLSMEFKDAAKKKGDPDTIYFNAFTEDLFTWDNDLEGDTDRVLKINPSSRFSTGLAEYPMDDAIRRYLDRYADFQFDIDYSNWTVSFSRGDVVNIKISRGEENVFIWCIFLAIIELVVEDADAYSWVRYAYIDDPVSSLDDNNVVAIACDLAQVLKNGVERLRAIISSHHVLFFNIISNELGGMNCKQYFLNRRIGEGEYGLTKTADTPFYNHVAMLDEIEAAVSDNAIWPYHFNILRGILEKTATFFGRESFSSCIEDDEDKSQFVRALNLYSHGSHSVFESTIVSDENRNLFIRILTSFLDRYPFLTPKILVRNIPESES